MANAKHISIDVDRRRDDPSTCRKLASEIIASWKQGKPAETQAAIGEHPQLKNYKSIVLDLAYEEYCLRKESREPFDTIEFCDRFPDYRNSLRRQIDFHKFLHDNPDLLVESLEAPWPKPGDQLHGYTIIEELGCGAFSHVYLANEKALGDRAVVIKVSIQGSEEAKTLGKLKHDNIVPIHSVVQQQDKPLTVICMPYLGRATLCDVLDRTADGENPPSGADAILEAIHSTAGEGRIAERSEAVDRCLQRGNYFDGLLHLGAQLADALAFAHSKGVYHLDLKPSNVLVTDAGRPMLLDFNLSFDQQLGEGRLGGTLPYMSPEQLQRCFDKKTDAQIDARSDIFSLGVILYELCTGELPFGPPSEDISSQQAADELLECQSQGLRPLPPEVQRSHDRLCTIIERCLAFDPAERYQSATELAVALRRELSPSVRLQRWFVNRRTAVAVAAVFLLTAFFAGVFYYNSLPSYAVRLYEAALKAFEEEKYDKAIKLLDRSIKENPKSSKAWLLRGRAKAKKGNFIAAIEDVLEAHNLVKNDANIMAFLGYCCAKAKVKDHPNAIQWNLRAIENGLNTANVYNNLGYSYLRINRPIEAQTHLDNAIQIAPFHQAALHNRAILDLNLAKKDNLPLISGTEWIANAIEHGEPSVELYCDAAQLYLYASKFDANLDAVMVKYLGSAIEAGADAKSLRRYASLAVLLNERPEVIQPFRKQRTINISVRATHIIDPLD